MSLKIIINQLIRYIIFGSILLIGFSVQSAIDKNLGTLQNNLIDLKNSITTVKTSTELLGTRLNMLKDKLGSLKENLENKEEVIAWEIPEFEYAVLYNRCKEINQQTYDQFQNSMENISLERLQEQPPIMLFISSLENNKKLRKSLAQLIPLFKDDNQGLQSFGQVIKQEVEKIFENNRKFLFRELLSENKSHPEVKEKNLSTLIHENYYQPITLYEIVTYNKDYPPPSLPKEFITEKKSFYERISTENTKTYLTQAPERIKLALNHFCSYIKLEPTLKQNYLKELNTILINKNSGYPNPWPPYNVVTPWTKFFNLAFNVHNKLAFKAYEKILELIEKKEKSLQIDQPLQVDQSKKIEETLKTIQDEAKNSDNKKLAAASEASRFIRFFTQDFKQEQHTKENYKKIIELFGVEGGGGSGRIQLNDVTIHGIEGIITSIKKLLEKIKDSPDFFIWAAAQSFSEKLRSDKLQEIKDRKLEDLYRYLGPIRAALRIELSK